MKILNLGDWHFGIKSDDPWIQHIQLDAIKQALDISKKHGITRWIQYGDIFDVRKAVTHKTMEFTREIVKLLTDNGIVMDTIIGNHDAHYRNTLTPNAITELLSQYSNINVYEHPTTVNYDGVDIDLIPWMCDENTKEILDFIKQSSSKYCIGHWELNGYYFYRGMKSHGLEPDFLGKYKQVWSGHFHTISEGGNVKYIGTPFTLTAGDENDPRGFWIFDTANESMDFVPNTTTWHRKIYYPNQKLKVEDFRNLSVRVIIEKVDKDLPKFESELEKVVHELRTVSRVDNSVELADGEKIEVKSMITLMDDYIDAISDISKEDSEILKKIAKQLYTEAQNQ